MALNPCAREILCALTQATLGALDQTITLLQVKLNTELARLTAELLKYNVAAAGVRAAGALAEEGLAAARSFANLLPLNILGGCADLGDLNVSASRIIDAASSDLAATVTDLTRLVSYEEELTFLRDQAADTLKFYDEIKLDIATCSGRIADAAAALTENVNI